MTRRGEGSDLSEESASDEPEAVIDAKLVLHHVIVHHTGVRIVPFIRGEPGHDEQGEADQDIGGENIEPDLHRQGVHEAERKHEVKVTWLLILHT